MSDPNCIRCAAEEGVFRDNPEAKAVALREPHSCSKEWLLDLWHDFMLSQG